MRPIRAVPGYRLSTNRTGSGLEAIHAFPLCQEPRAATFLRGCGMNE